MDRNVILFVVLTATVIIGWEALVAGPQREAYRKSLPVEQAAPASGGTLTGDIVSAAGEGPALEIKDALAKSPARITIDTPSLQGSINLDGGRIDDLSLKNYRETLDRESPMIRLLAPREAVHGHYIEQGWVASDGATSATTESATWSAPAGAVLSPATPVTLTARIGSLVFENKYSVDDKFMFTVEQTVRNEGATPARAAPYGLVVQRGIPGDAGKQMILHEGPVAVIGKQLIENKYQKAVKRTVEQKGELGWVGITNKYWLAAVAPPQSEAFTVTMRNVGSPTTPVFRANYALAERALAPGETISLTSQVFGGAKVVSILQEYEKSKEQGGAYGIWDLDRAVDWGNFFILTRPIFFLLDFFGKNVGNFGIAILLLTLVVKALMFPLANKAFESMSAMKKVQPKLEELKAKYGEDKAKLQQEMMALYQREKINPLAGCLPIIVQMPIFYALYKTLFVTIELRHQPFFGWIRDLSAPDPTNIFNLFGLLPFDPSATPLLSLIPAIGVLPILYGVSMWFQTKLNPPAADPVQQQVMTMLPFIFVFLFASFSAGLVLYWLWSAVLSILQQWYIMKKSGVSVEWGERLPFLRGKKPALEKK